MNSCSPSACIAQWDKKGIAKLHMSLQYKYPVKFNRLRLNMTRGSSSFTKSSFLTEWQI